MKKNIRRAITLAMALTLLMSNVAMADTIISNGFTFSQVATRPTEVPTATPTAEPTATPVPTEAPTQVPVETATPTAEPTAVPTAEPTAAPTAEPTAEPTPEPTAEPLPDPVVTITSNLEGMAAVEQGTQMVLTMHAEGLEGRPYTIQWQQSVDGGATWQDIAGANGEQYVLSLMPEHTYMWWRVVVDVEDAVPAA